MAAGIKNIQNICTLVNSYPMIMIDQQMLPLLTGLCPTQFWRTLPQLCDWSKFKMVNMVITCDDLSEAFCDR